MYVVAFIDQHTVKVLKSAQEAPRGSIVFSSPEELEKALSMQQLDAMRKRLLGDEVEPSPSRGQSATRLWHALTLASEFSDEVRLDIYRYNKKKDAFGNDKISDESKIELLQMAWVPGKDHMVDFFVKKLPPQAKKIVEILHDDGRALWTIHQVRVVVEARASEIKTKQGVETVLKYYMSELCMKKILRRVSYVEFASKPEFSGLSLDKEDL